MNADSEWEMVRPERQSTLGHAGMGAVRVALLFGSAAVAFALLATPFAENHSRPRVAGASLPAGLDFTSTGTVPSREGYTVRRSVLQPSPQSLCVIHSNGARSGSC